MAGLWFRQLGVLFWKNWIVLSKYPLLNLVRCFIMPVAYGIFLAVAQLFLTKPNNFGIGSAVPVFSLSSQYDGSMQLLWADGTGAGGSNTFLSAETIMGRLTRGFSSRQLRGIRQAAHPGDIPAACPQNFNLFSECFGAVVFNALPASAQDLTPVNYTIRADGGLWHVDVVRHKSDYEKRILPLQFALDHAIIELRTGVEVSTPLQLPYTEETNKQQFTDIRLSYIRGLRTLLVLALFICFVGIAYQLPGAYMAERANLLTSHLKAMGLRDSARIVSWHLSITLAYLPAWIIVALIWHYRIFTATSAWLVLAVHLLLGLTLASHAFFLGAPFARSPQLAAVTSTFFAIVFAILALVCTRAGTGVALVFTLVFPPGFYIFAIRAMCGFEAHQMATDALKGDPDHGLVLLPLLIAAVINVFLWPWLATLLEHRLYDAREPSSGWRCFGRRKKGGAVAEASYPPDTAISIRDLGKSFKAPFFQRKKGPVTAVDSLSLDIPKNGIFVLLGSNGAGKSTTLSIIGGLLGRSRGTVAFAGGAARPPRGTIGIVPQKNVLFPELTCLQNLRVWRAVKRAGAGAGAQDEDLAQLLRDCDLGKKIDANADTLSGGQKRKLQLAIGLVGGSSIVLVDECTSGVDPLSRRSLWRTLTSVRHERTIVFTTHFLDEADLLADRIAILAAPGKLVAEGTPVALKSTMGEGYIVQVTFDASPAELEKTPEAALLERLRTVAPSCYVCMDAPGVASYHLKSKDSLVVRTALQLLDDEKASLGVDSYDVHGTSIEDIFLELMSAEDPNNVDHEKLVRHSSKSSIASLPGVLALTDGRKQSPLSQTLTIFHKRLLIARRSWLTPLMAVLLAVCGACVPIFFIEGRTESCVRRFDQSDLEPLYFPLSPLGYVAGPGAPILEYPANIIASLGSAAANLSTTSVADNATLVNTVRSDYQNLELGGISIDFDTGDSLFAWEATPPGTTGPTMLNLLTNVVYNRALNSSGKALPVPSLIAANYQSFPPVAAGTLVALKWVAFFGAAMAVYPAFFSLYVSRERRSSVQAMQLSNGLSNPAGLWLGHLMFDSIFSVFAATVTIIVFTSQTAQFHGLGFFWVVLVLYGVAGTLFAYCVSLFVASPLAAFAATAGYQIIMYILYLASYLLVLTYAKTSDANSEITTIHFTFSLLSPVPSILRAAFVSVNLFSLLCAGEEPVNASSMGSIMRYGGPIVYLILYSFFLFGVLVWHDSGSLLPRRLRFRKRRIAPGATRAPDAPHPAPAGGSAIARPDVEEEARAVAGSDDALRVLRLSKAFDGKKVVEDVSFGVSSGTMFALLGPNGAGKTTTFNMIRGDVLPSSGDVLIQGHSAVTHPRAARLALGVCPQFTAIDAQLTVAEHLGVYGRLKGLRRGPELRANVDAMLVATALEPYRERLASALSGGNQRKLALAIALMGNPSVVLIDEFSSGVDAKMKRDMWGTLRGVAAGKAVVITTHSMEEASALASKVGILAKRMLAVGTTASLEARYATYEVHFSCRTRADAARAEALMARIAGARRADDVATRFEVPVGRAGGLSLAALFAVLAEQGDFEEYTVERPTLESVFLKVIRAAEVEEDEEGRAAEGRRSWWRRARRLV